MNEIILAGCTPTPLANYLKALGVFRLVAEQKDSEARACWRGERFVLVTRLEAEEVERFFLEEYRPTPIISPWNGRAGYLEEEEDSTRRGPELLRKFRDSSANRLNPYRTLIGTLDEFDLLRQMNEARATKKALEKEKKANPSVWSMEKQEQLATAAKKDAFLKEQQLKLLRNNLPDEQLAWLDAAVAIGSEKAYTPLLGGSGGVEGSMDLGVNFMDNLVLLFSFDSAGGAAADSSAWLAHALTGTNTRLTAKNTAGSLSPGCVGGPNATSGFSQGLNVNPWDFVLMIEGAVAFRPSLTRKLESTGQARLSYPFTVEPSSIGAGAVSVGDEKKTRAGSSEVWMPLWRNPANFAELIALLREGNIRLGAKAPKDGLDMARCIASLGMDRGIHGFQRYLFLKRSGDNDLAIPLARFVVSRDRNRKADLIADLEQNHFLELLRRAARDKDAPASIKRATAQLENVSFALTRPGAGRQAVQRALILLGEVMQTLAVSRKGQKAVPALPRLSESWVLQADDGSSEFRLAVALAGLDNMQSHLAPVAWNDKSRRPEWHADSRLFVWGKGDLARNLVSVVERRVIEARRQESVREPFASRSRMGARLADIQAFLSGQTDDGRIAALLQGLVWVKLSEALVPATNDRTNGASVPTAYAVLKPFFTPPALLKHLGRLPEDAHLTLPGELSRLLAAGQVPKAYDIAWRRARIAGLGWPKGEVPQTSALNGPRLLAALAIPLEAAALAQLLPRVENLQPESV